MLAILLFPVTYNYRESVLTGIGGVWIQGEGWVWAELSETVQINLFFGAV